MKTVNHQRDAFFDNAKYLLVLFVVFGHLISPYRESSELIFHINNFLASFRMPALILITGYFAKGFYKEGHIKKVTIRLFIPFLILQFIYTYYYTATGSTLNWFSPRMGLWFLLSLYYFNLLLFIFNKLRQPIIISFILGITIGCIDYVGSTLSISRTFFFFPFFLIGFYLQRSHIEYLKKATLKILSVFTFAAMVYLLSFYSLEEARGLFLGKYSYEHLGYSISHGMMARGMIYIIMALAIITFIAWVPKTKTVFSHLGQKTAYIYLLHFLIIGKVRALVSMVSEFSNWMLPVYLLVSIIVTIGLSRKPIIVLTKPIIEGTIYDKAKHILERFKEHNLRKKKKRFGLTNIFTIFVK